MEGNDYKSISPIKKVKTSKIDFSEITPIKNEIRGKN